MKKHRKKIIITAIVLLLVAAILFVYFAFFHVPKEERIHRKLMTAHTASNTALLGSDKFFDKPDFMIYEIGGERIECTPEEADAIYAEFKKMIANVDYMGYFSLFPVLLEEYVPDLKGRGAVRFCYEQRRKYTGKYPHETPVYYPYPEPYIVQDTLYNWEDFTFDEVLISSYDKWMCDIVLGENGEYKAPRREGTDKLCRIELNVWDINCNYFATDFDLAVKKILKIEERFPELFVEEK